MPRDKVQRETIIRFNPREPEATVSSDDLAFHRRMMKLGVVSLPDTTYRVPKDWIQIGPPRKRRFTEAQRDHKRVILAQNIRLHLEKREHRTAA